MKHTARLANQKKGALSSLFALESPLEGETGELESLADEHGLVFIRGCRRKVAFGLGEPPAAPPSAQLYTGEEAYAHLLKYQTGLLSRSPGESQIVGQFANAFRTREEKHPESLLDYGKLNQWLTEDNRTVRKSVTSDLQSAYFETVAQRIDGRPANEPVTIVIDEDSRGHLSDTTRNLLRQLGSFSLNAPNLIQFTHYDSNVLARHRHEIEEMARRGTISTPVEAIDFDAMLAAPLDSQLFRNLRHIYVCPACDSNPEAEAKLVAWQDEAAAFGTKMVLLGGDKKHRRTEGAWQGEHFNLMLPEDISMAQKAKKTENAGLIQAGKLACDNCATSRDLGKRPLQRSLTSPSEDYLHLHGHSGIGQQRQL